MAPGGGGEGGGIGGSGGVGSPSKDRASKSLFHPLPVEIAMSPLTVNSSRPAPPSPAVPRIVRLPAPRTVVPGPARTGMSERRLPLNDSAFSSNPESSGTVRRMLPENDRIPYRPSAARTPSSVTDPETVSTFDSPRLHPRSATAPLKDFTSSRGVRTFSISMSPLTVRAVRASPARTLVSSRSPENDSTVTSLASEASRTSPLTVSTRVSPSTPSTVTAPANDSMVTPAPRGIATR